MLSNTNGRVVVALLLLALMVVAGVTLTRPGAVLAQGGQMGGGGGGMMGGMRAPMPCVAASGDFVYVTMGTMLFKFDAKTLTLQGKAELPKPPPPTAPAGPPPQQ